jgi:hypothetical protein
VGIYMKSDPKLLDAANTIRDNLGAAVDQIGCQASLNPDAMQCLVARAYLAAKAQMDQLNVNTTAATDARMRVLTGQVWGVDDIPGDKVSASISYRDATDRAQALTSPHDAMILLTTAERSGDELLARAVACQADAMAWDDVAGAWDDVAGAYFATRPVKAKQNAELHSLVPSLKSMNATDLFMFILPAPAGLDGLNPYRIQQIADDPRFTNI